MVKVKICGLQTQADIEAANLSQPDYIGFIFVKQSKRYILPDHANRLRQLLNQPIQAVGIFVNEEHARIVDIAQAGTIDLVQLHGDEDDNYIHTLKKALEIPVIKAVSVGKKVEASSQSADYLLFDTETVERGGSGQAFDWGLISEFNKQPFFLAGGLNTENIQAALAVVQPFALDVSSGVETDGKKDPQKMRDFVEKVREQTR